MKRLVLTATLALLSFEATAVGRTADVTIIDRDHGRSLPTYYYRGEYWVAGTPGSRYGIEVRSHTGERLLAVMAVDGVNVVTGETASFAQNGYVFYGHQSYDITGWRKSNSEVASFVFAAAPDSYAARTGRAANVGVIGVALFRELTVPATPALSDNALGGLGAARDSAARAREVPASAPPAEAAERSLAGKATVGAEARIAMAPAPALGTAHGARENSVVEHTDFTRRQATPDEVIRIRYDSYENLVAQGVIRRQPPRLPGPEAFPESGGQGYVPDPPGYSGGGLR